MPVVVFFVQWGLLLAAIYVLGHVLGHFDGVDRVASS